MPDRNGAIYDARTLGTGKMLLLGVQHMFAMFGATILVPLITGLSISTTLLMAGIGTLLFHFVTGKKVPAFLGSSFAFLGGYAAIAPSGGMDGMTQQELLPYACFGVACSGILYLILAAAIKKSGSEKVLKFFPPIVTGPIIIAIGLGLSGSAIQNCQQDWLVAVVALAVIIYFNIWGKGMTRIIPIILGVLSSYAVAVLRHSVDFTPIKEAPWFGNPITWNYTVFGGVDFANKSLVLSAVIAIVPIALATMMEHIGDISAISATVGKNYLEDPGLNKTLLGDGAATILASLFGGPANTTYGENTGVLALTKVYDPRVIRIAAVFAMLFSFSPKFSAVISTIPAATIGGVSFILYGMISAAGVRNVVESHVDFSKSRNLIIAAVILVSSLGMTAGITFHVGAVTITLSALAVGSILGILLNAILPDEDEPINVDSEPYETGMDLSIINATELEDSIIEEENEGMDKKDNKVKKSRKEKGRIRIIGVR